MYERVKTMKEVIAERIKPEVIQKENEELKAALKEAEDYENKMREKINYLRGRIDGLEFSIRCNGVSGDLLKNA